MRVSWNTLNGTASGEVVSEIKYYKVRLDNGKTMIVAEHKLNKTEDETHRH